MCKLRDRERHVSGADLPDPTDINVASRSRTGARTSLVCSG